MKGDNAGAGHVLPSGGASLSVAARLTAYDQLAPDVRRVIATAPVELRVDHLPEWQRRMGGAQLAAYLRNEIQAAWPGYEPPERKR